jgi:threonine synthase
LSNSSSHFLKSIDTKYPAEKSIVLRYRHAFTFGTPDEDSRFKDLLKKTSIREGSRIFFLLKYKGVEIFAMDETSLMHTNTLKSIDGCVTIARCKQAGYDRVVLETGGNTGSALTAYGTRAGLEMFCFMPGENLRLLNSKFFTSPKAHLISVKDPGMVKDSTERFQKHYGLIHIPRIEWRFEASRFRGLRILEYMLGESRKFDWITQTISAAFGPIGIYWSFEHLGNMRRVPRFMGIQQEVNCPMYRAWKARRRNLRPLKITSTSKLLSPVMYDVKPHTYGTYRDLLGVLEETKGELCTISHAEFNRFLDRDFDGSGIRGLLKEHGIEMGEVKEKTGLIALAGTLKAIDVGTIGKGNRVLWCLTSGVSNADGRATAEFEVTNLKKMLKDYEERFHLVAQHGRTTQEDRDQGLDAERGPGHAGRLLFPGTKTENRKTAG